MKKLLPALLVLIGIGGGVGAGLIVRPKPEMVAHAAEKDPAATADTAHAKGVYQGAAAPEYIKIQNQFIVPLVEGKRVTSLVILTLSLEVSAGMREAVYAKEPKLRDSFLQVLFDHANVGGFSGAFTDARNLTLLRKRLLDQARAVLGDKVTDVLITDIARQDS